MRQRIPNLKFLGKCIEVRAMCQLLLLYRNDKEESTRAGLNKNHENLQSFNKESFNLTHAMNYIAYRQDFHIVVPSSTDASQFAAILSRAPEDVPSTPRAGPSRLPTIPEMSCSRRQTVSVVTSQRTVEGRARCRVVPLDDKTMEMPNGLSRDVQDYMTIMPRTISAIVTCIFLFHPTRHRSLMARKCATPLSAWETLGFSTATVDSTRNLTPWTTPRIKRPITKLLKALLTSYSF
ncbi:unnamed protein product [Cyclocybe aegerita]|uniref:Uncharacterized protein n=1 Tax=Cyclocybe aegerita TaxID=1973307 RepID=A0A8S0X1Q8_CYCAE|nr:unnamed protein product [Cyclocybe aegerita]